MKKFLSLFLIITIILTFASCKGKNKLDPKKPVTIDFWHVYGELASSPIDKYIDTFNETVGKEEGIVVNVTLLANAQDIGNKLEKAFKNAPGAPDMPDLFTCHKNDCLNLGVENLIDWNEEFSTEELENYIPSFINEGVIDDSLVVFPISKSTHVLYVAGSQLSKLFLQHPELKKS